MGLKPVRRRAWPKTGWKPESKNSGKAWTTRVVKARSGLLCERCGSQGHSLHHLKNRSQGGEWSPQNCVWLCGDGCVRCHGWATTHPDEAWDTGFHVRPWETPGERPIHSRLHGVVYLLADGSTVPAGDAA